MQSAARNLVAIGGGNMGRAVLAAAERATGLVSAMMAADVSRESRAAIDRQFGGRVRVFEGAAEAVAAGGAGAVLLVAVKPQVFPSVAAEIAGAFRGLVVSIMAGTRSARVAELLGDGRAGVRVVRAMPNLALAHGEGVTALAAGPGATEEDMTFAERLFAAGGSTVQVSEDLFDAFTALAGSGPAYVFYLAEAMERAGAAVGFTPEQSRQIVRQTVLGAAAMLRASSGGAPAELRAGVTSKGGVTEAAVGRLEAARVAEVMVEAIRSGRDRGRELAG